MKRKLAVLSMIMVMVLTMIPGCSKQPSKENKGTNENSTEQESKGTEEGKTDGESEKTTPEAESNTDKEDVTILIAAAASMEKSLEELIPQFQTKYPWITVEGTYDSSGKLQTQIEEGLEADIFLSAAMKQMNALKDENMIDADSIKELLENKVVLIVPAGSESKVTSFEDILGAGTIAIGDPESVPAGQYAKKVFDSLGIYDKVAEKASLGTNVTEVLNWVAEGSADAGVVYATDAATSDKVTVISEAPEGSLDEKVIYPIGIVTASQKKEAAALLVEYLQSEEATNLFVSYGFSVQ
ncbi:molybdate ABC transporter substrate-binding protein [Anaerocolumna aminovalerica]|uniref:molybdate ABC transporter substrate-binding protein n=1 Tax=Anaerocolumna aminovalerica TaxID=1527 RepID=UPI001C0ECE91|nr:molybdate ABC transporter substrate-binding protein [Anaerocolumna aminovalerica]MBU5330827.1 molybdate ABC transporter substrate-binding protein [Anaerocolumna aminovalerica]